MVDLGPQVKGVAEKLDLLGKVLFPIKFIPGAGEAVGIVQDVVGKLSEAAKSAAESAERDLDSMKGGIDGELSKLDRKIVVTIDDIDRLSDVEIRQVFQLVKSLGDFKNTIYFLLFDRAVVAKALDSAQSGSGLNYLEKIIQVPFELPSPSKEQVLNLVLKRLDVLLQGTDKTNWEPSYWGNVLHSGFKHHFKNLRDADRFLSVFSFNFGLLGGEVNPIDLVAMTAIQVFQPKLFFSIKESRELFLGEAGRFLGSGEAERKRSKELCDKAFSVVTGDFSSQVEKHLRRLFPQLDSYYGNTSHSGWGAQWRKTGRICSSTHFNKFFSLSISADDVSRAEMDQLVSTASHEAKFRAHLVDLWKRGLAERALDYLLDYTESAISEKDLPCVMRAVLDESDQFIQRHSRSILSGEFGSDLLILRLVHHLLKRFKTCPERTKVFTQAVKSVKKSIYSITHVIVVMAQEHGEYRGRQEPPGEHLVDNADLPSLKKIAGQKIKEFAKQGLLDDHPKLWPVVNLWKEWGKASDCDAYMRKRIKSDEGLIKVVGAYTTIGHQSSISDYTSKEYRKGNPEALKAWIKPPVLKARLKRISKAPTFIGADQNMKADVQAFLDALSDKQKAAT